MREHGPEFCAFCTDDREPDMLLREGHINQMCRIAVREGVPVEDVLVMATLNAAQAHRLDGLRGDRARATGPTSWCSTTSLSSGPRWSWPAAASPRATAVA